jgi:endosialidase-like protein
MKRLGILMVATAAAVISTATARAADMMPNGTAENFVGSCNSGSACFTVTASGDEASALVGNSSVGYAVQGNATGSDPYCGLYGGSSSSNTSSCGVFGGSNWGTGVTGSGVNGVWGTTASANGNGVTGVSTNAVSSGVIGLNNSGGDGVTGISNNGLAGYFVGAVLIDGALTVSSCSGCASDIRLKKNVQPLGGAIDQLLQLRGVTFSPTQGSHVRVEKSKRTRERRANANWICSAGSRKSIPGMGA